MSRLNKGLRPFLITVYYSEIPELTTIVTITIVRSIRTRNVMRVFKTKAFQRWLNKQSLTNEDLSKAVSEIELGLVDANLGGFLY